MQQGSVVALFVRPSKEGYERVDRLSVVTEMGIEGDLYFGRDERQILFLSTEDLQTFGYGPGDWREQVTVDMPGLQSLEAGTLVTVGSVPFCVEQDCAPCAWLATRLGEEPVGFVRKVLKRRGMFLKPLGDGEIQVGDPLKVEGA